MQDAQTDRERQRERAAAAAGGILCTRLCALLRPIFGFKFEEAEERGCFETCRVLSVHLATVV